MPFRMFFLASLLLLVSACSLRQDEAAPIPEEEFVRLYADMLIAREELTLRGMAGETDAWNDSLYRAYGVSADKVASTLRTYQSELSSWKAFHEKVTHRLEALQQEMAAKRLHR